MLRLGYKADRIFSWSRFERSDLTTYAAVSIVPSSAWRKMYCTRGHNCMLEQSMHNAHGESEYDRIQMCTENDQKAARMLPKLLATVLVLYGCSASHHFAPPPWTSFMKIQPSSRLFQNPSLILLYVRSRPPARRSSGQSVVMLPNLLENSYRPTKEGQYWTVAEPEVDLTRLWEIFANDLPDPGAVCSNRSR